MNDSSGRPEPLDFEKPIAELEVELDQMREKAQSVSDKHLRDHDTNANLV